MATVLITGGGSGLGLALAQRLSAEGFDVVAGVRKLTGKRVDGVRFIAMDVTDSNAVPAAVEGLQSEGIAIDVLIANAGRHCLATVEGAGQGARESFETNFWGVANAVQAVLPGMRKRNNGRIIAISSLSAAVGLPCDGFYAASKAAMERLLESLRAEVAPFGVSVSVISPGAFPSQLFNGLPESAEQEDPYRPLLEHALNSARKTPEGLSMQELESLVLEVVSAPSPSFLYPAGDTAKSVLASLAQMDDQQRQAAISRWSGTEWWGQAIPQPGSES